jgi:ATP-dependent Clp protease protease subunit
MFLSKINKGYGEEVKQSFYLLMDDITLESCKEVIHWIMEANYGEERPEIMTLFINSPGGDVNAAFALIDVMRGSAIPIRTVGLGEISSCGFMIFISGKKGERILTPNTSILSHQYSWGAVGKHHDLMGATKQFTLTHEKIVKHYKKCIPKLSEEDIRSKLLPPHDVWLSAEEAYELGICDKIKELN